MRFIIIVFLAAAVLLAFTLFSSLSVKANGSKLNLLYPSPHMYVADAPSTKKILQWVYATFRHTEPVVLDSQLVAVPVRLKAGRRSGSVACTLTITVTSSGYEYSVSHLRHEGNGWLEDQAQLGAMAPRVEIQLTRIRHQFEEWLANTDSLIAVSSK